VKWAKSLVIALALAGGAWPRALLAEEDATLAQTRVVRIQVDGDAAAVARTRAVASELFERLGVASIVSAEPEPEADTSGRQALARAYFDLRDPTKPGIVVVDAASEREVLRRTLPDSASLEISVEELTHVLYAVIEALLQTERAPESTPAPPPAEPPPPPPKALPPPDTHEPAPRRPASGPSVAVGAFARLLAFDSSSILPGGGLGLAARSRDDGFAYGGSLMAAMQASNEIVFEEARGGVRPFAFRAYGTATGFTASGVALSAGLGGGIDLLRVESESLPVDAHTETSTVVDAILSSWLGARIPLGGRVSLDAAFTLDLDLTPRRFVVEQGNRRATLFELGRFRPAFVLGGSYSLVGSDSSGGAGARP
jgi:hypothetical protein